MERGPVEVIGLGFPRSVGPERMTDVLRRPVDERFLVLIDLVFLLRDDGGELTARDVEHEMFRLPELAGLMIDAHTLLSADDLQMFADSLAPDQHGVAAVVEHAWARDVGHRLADLGAEIALHARISDFDVAAAYAADHQAV